MAYLPSGALMIDNPKMPSPASEDAQSDALDVSEIALVDALKQSELFDPDWYLKHNPDVAVAGMDPALHYVQHGRKEGRLPSKIFDSAFYLSQLDAPLNTEDAFLHFVTQGKAAGLQPCRLLNNEYAIDDLTPNAPISNSQEQPSPISEDVKSDVSGSEVALVAALKQSELFDPDWYLKQYPDVAIAGVDPALHYVQHGRKEGRLPSKTFDSAFYLSQLEAPLNTEDAFLHFVTQGEAAGLQPCRSWNHEPWWWQLPDTRNKSVNTSLLRLGLEHSTSVVVIVPVFNALTELTRCLASLEKYASGIGKVLLINDASTDPSVSNLLSRYHHKPLFMCLSNRINLGFSGTVNRGITLAKRLYPSTDIVLLNSDTEVSAGWLRQLRLAAYHAPNIATATPVSNNAGAFSVPLEGENLIPAQFGLTAFARVCAQAGIGNYPIVPTGNGFCLYIRRQALDEIGYFDAAAFPRGYGEENDFCMRALHAGWQHCIAPRAFVYHQRSASFGSEKAKLLEQGRKIIDQRYPDYRDRVKYAFQSNEVKAMRERAQVLSSFPAELARQIKPRVLFVVSTRTGGTPQTNQDLMQALASHCECFILRSDSKTISLEHYLDGVYTSIEQHNLSVAIQAMDHVSSEYDHVVTSWLIEWNIELVHVRHLAWHSLGLLKTVKALALPLIHSFHDFYTLCPTVKLLDENKNYCAATCSNSRGKCQHELWPEQAFANLKHDQVYQWRLQFYQSLQLCDAFVTTHQSAKQLIQQQFPALVSKPFLVIEHGRDFFSMQSLASKPNVEEKLRIMILGNISIAKGLALISQLANRYGNEIEIHILGTVSNELVLPDNVILHGGYSRDNVTSMIANINPHIGAVLSIWPETWCHTLTELWSAGLPVVALNYGAVGQRIEQTGAGWLVNSNDVTDIAAVLLSSKFADEWQIKMQAVLQWQLTQGVEQSCLEMAEHYLALYHQFVKDIPAQL